MNTGLLMKPVLIRERKIFLEMAKKHFKELNPNFVPFDDWKAHYFESIQSNESIALRWITVKKKRVGFILFGVEKHRFLPRKIGAIYELYVVPKYRRRGIGRTCAGQVIDELQALRVSRIQLEVTKKNGKAASLWRQLGFEKVSERFVFESAD